MLKAVVLEPQKFVSRIRVHRCAACATKTKSSVSPKKLNTAVAKQATPVFSSDSGSKPSTIEC